MAGRIVWSLLPGALAAMGLAVAVAIHIWNPAPRVLVIQFAYGAVSLAMLLAAGRADTPWRSLPGWVTPALIAGTALVSAIMAWAALEAYPGSADEYGFNYLADTLLHGRLWNPAYPEPIRDVFATNYIGGHGVQRLSQYPPGWPAVLAPFRWWGVPEFANVAVGLAAAGFLLLALRRVPAPRNVRLAALALGVAAPFTVFNNASFFAHPLSAAALLAAVWLDGGEAQPSVAARAGIGLAFSVLLAARPEVCVLCAPLVAADALCRRGWRAIGWGVPIVLGAVPVVALLLLYNWKITGSPFTSTQAWVNPEVGFGLHAAGMDGPNTPVRSVWRTVGWLGRWQEFGSALLLPLYAVALWARVRARSVRWFDLVLPTLVAFFFFYPDDGGWQYGPRYWYPGHAVMPVTIAAGLPLAGQLWRLGRWRFDPMRLAAAQMAGFAGFALGFAVYLHLQTENRMAVPRIAATAPPPAVVLVETIGRRYLPWQGYAYQFFPKDYTRNGLDGLGPIAVGLYLGEERTALLCQQMPDRHIYRLLLDHVGAGGTLVPQCDGR